MQKATALQDGASTGQQLNSPSQSAWALSAGNGGPLTAEGPRQGCRGAGTWGVPQPSASAVDGAIGVHLRLRQPPGYAGDQGRARGRCPKAHRRSRWGREATRPDVQHLLSQTSLRLRRRDPVVSPEPPGRAPVARPAVPRRRRAHGLRERVSARSLRSSRVLPAGVVSHGSQEPGARPVGGRPGRRLSRFQARLPTPAGRTSLSDGAGAGAAARATKATSAGAGREESKDGGVLKTPCEQDERTAWERRKRPRTLRQTAAPSLSSGL